MRPRIHIWSFPPDLKRYLLRFMFFFLWSVFRLGAWAQDSTNRFSSSGGLVGYGRQINIDSRYNPVFFTGDFSWQFGKQRRKDFLAFYLEPQFNLAATKRHLDKEFGCNIGLRYYQQVSPALFFYEMLGSGPHFITAHLAHQARGFIFSDNLAIGLYRRLSQKKSLFLNFQFRVRHISNAGLKLPNSGVNTLNVLVGLAKFR
ncbi:MAG: acyloxyacyl hydrolase [Flavisolibacter sp.]